MKILLFFFIVLFTFPVFGYDDPFTPEINEGVIGMEDDPFTDKINEGLIGTGIDDPFTSGINEGNIEIKKEEEDDG